MIEQLAEERLSAFLPRPFSLEERRGCESDIMRDEPARGVAGLRERHIDSMRCNLRHVGGGRGARANRVVFSRVQTGMVKAQRQPCWTQCNEPEEPCPSVYVTIAARAKKKNTQNRKPRTPVEQRTARRPAMTLSPTHGLLLLPPSAPEH